MLNQIIDQELVLRNLLGKFLPLVSYLVANEQQRYSHALLRETDWIWSWSDRTSN